MFRLESSSGPSTKCIKDLYIFVEGPDDDSNGIETCRPSPINSVLMIVVFDWTILYILHIKSFVWLQFNDTCDPVNATGMSHLKVVESSLTTRFDPSA